MAAPDALDASGFLEALGAAARVLDSHSAALDRLHHPPSPEAPDAPIPPGAGTELSSALAAAVERAEGCRSFAAASDALVAGAAAVARGRAGRATVELLAGIGDVLRNADRLDAIRFALGLEAAVERLSVHDDGSRPGGFTAVLAVVADTALSMSDAGAGLADTVIAAADAGVEELERGPEADHRLAAKGVVDAGAAGFLLVLDTLASVLTGEPLPAAPLEGDLRTPRQAPTATHLDISCQLEPFEGGVEAAVGLEDTLLELGEVLRWEALGPVWNVAVRTAFAGAVVEALADTGRLRETRIVVADSPAVARVPAASAR